MHLDHPLSHPLHVCVDTALPGVLERPDFCLVAPDEPRSCDWRRTGDLGRSGRCTRPGSAKGDGGCHESGAARLPGAHARSDLVRRGTIDTAGQLSRANRQVAVAAEGGHGVVEWRSSITPEQESARVITKVMQASPRSVRLYPLPSSHRATSRRQLRPSQDQAEATEGHVRPGRSSSGK